MDSENRIALHDDFSVDNLGSKRGIARHLRWILPLVPVVALLVWVGCVEQDEEGDWGEGAVTTSGDPAIQKIATERNLTPDDIAAALKTYTPSGRHDKLIMFASGGHSGQVFMIGLPSMRILRSVAVFSPESWQGWGFGGSEKILASGDKDGVPLRWGDTHHPALSQTDGDYDGQYLFINDKASARLAVIDLRDFETKQIVKSPIAIGDHGGSVVTPNTDYIIEGGQYAAPLGWGFSALENYKKDYRGYVTFWKFDRKAGRIDLKRSFAMELPPYWQDLFSTGKKVSEGWVFGNSFNTEMATGGIEKGNPPFEIGVSQHDTDYMHIINLKKAITLFENGKCENIKGFSVLPLKTSIDENILFFAPEPKSPHGVDVTPGGEYAVVSGKLDPHVTVYSFDKIQKAIAAKNWKHDPFGVPILDLDAVMEAQVELGLGPLHTQYDEKGYAYTSLFLDSAVARWTLGGDYAKKHDEPSWQLVSKVPVQYNVGHIAVVGGDTCNPRGRFLVALNKWSVDRFFMTGPLLPQNLQLIDIDEPGERMQVLYDMPMGIGEPHYAQIMEADKLKPWKVYPEIGWDPETQAVDPNAALPGKERIERKGKTVEVFMTAIRSHYTPEHVEVQQGDHVIWHITNTERAQDATHGFALCGYNVNLSLEPGESQTFEFDADHPGVFSYYCTEFCSALHLEMTGYLLVKP